MVFVNSHFSQHGVQPYLPNVIEIGGIQINSEPVSLTADIQNWLNESTDGAIFVSLGEGSKMSNDTIELLLDSFRKLKQRVLWKFKEKQIPYFPKNVKIQSKIESSSVLVHPNIRAFVTNGQLDRVNEAMYHAVPIVGIPSTADQYSNTRLAQEDGWGEVITSNNLTETGLDETLKQVIYVKTYKEKVIELSKTFRDRPQMALNTTIYWMEYVIKYGGAHHLKYQGRFLNAWQSTSLDILALAVACSWVLYKLVVFILRKIFRKKTRVVENVEKLKNE